MLSAAFAVCLSTISFSQQAAWITVMGVRSQTQDPNTGTVATNCTGTSPVCFRYRVTNGVTKAGEADMYTGDLITEHWTYTKITVNKTADRTSATLEGARRIN